MEYLTYLTFASKWIDENVSGSLYPNLPYYLYALCKFLDNQNHSGGSWITILHLFAKLNEDYKNQTLTNL